MPIGTETTPHTKKAENQQKKVPYTSLMCSEMYRNIVLSLTLTNVDLNEISITLRKIPYADGFCILIYIKLH